MDTDPRQWLGREAERIVAEGLEALGWEVVERNARFRTGEIDLVARDGSSLVFVEVKASRSRRNSTSAGPERPVLAVDSRKQSRLRALAARWLMERDCPAGIEDFRFDVVGVEFAGDGPEAIPRLEHLRGAF